MVMIDVKFARSCVPLDTLQVSYAHAEDSTPYILADCVSNHSMTNPKDLDHEDGIVEVDV